MHVVLPTMVRTMDHPDKYVNKLLEKEESCCSCVSYFVRGGGVPEVVVPNVHDSC